MDQNDDVELSPDDTEVFRVVDDDGEAHLYFLPVGCYYCPNDALGIGISNTLAGDVIRPFCEKHKERFEKRSVSFTWHEFGE